SVKRCWSCGGNVFTIPSNSSAVIVQSPEEAMMRGLAAGPCKRPESKNIESRCETMDMRQYRTLNQRVKTAALRYRCPACRFSPHVTIGPFFSSSLNSRMAPLGYGTDHQCELTPLEHGARGSMTRLKDFLSKYEELFRRSFLLAVLLALPAIGILRWKVDLEDADIWWHLRTGEWILSHHMLPFTDPFSLHGAGKEWVAYSWLFEVLVFRLYQWFGLSGILYYNVVLSIAITAAVFTLIKRFEPAFISVVGLAAISIVSMLPVLLAPRPWLFTILFFTIELKLLLDARRTGSNRSPWYLPFLFALWANLHIQFVYGLLLL